MVTAEVVEAITAYFNEEEEVNETEEVDIKIEDKIKSAPNSNYEIGVFIGSMLPFILLVTAAYLIYRYNKKRQNR
mgnify:CR=1 FL=1